MRQISGVTGAAPLWNRIMLHLHSSQEPANFPPPSGMVKLPMCAISGLKPTPSCTSVVEEYFYPEDKSNYERLELNLPGEYDEWLARQNQFNLTSNNFKILSPHNRDLFLLYPGEEGKQKLEFKLGGISSTPVEWSLNNQKLDTSANALFWTLRPGNWTLSAKSGEISDKVTFEVQLANIKPTRRGFSVVNSTESQK